MIEKIIIYGIAILLSVVTMVIYLRRQKANSDITKRKIERAKTFGLFEPVSLYPSIDESVCINCASCVKACPEQDILGVVDGKAKTIQASNCVGHGACFHACPTEAISLRIGTEQRGVDLPHVQPSYETNIEGIYIAGELGGMGLIKNAVRQGRMAVQNIADSLDTSHDADYDLLIVGAGPSGISASLEAKREGLRFMTLEQDTLGGTVYTFPRAKVVMTSPMNLPLHGKVKLYETSKQELLDLWKKVLRNNQIDIHEQRKVTQINIEAKHFSVTTKDGQTMTTAKVLLAIGRRGSPRKLNVPGENLEKVAYRLLEPEHILGKNVLVVGGGDSAIESAMLLSEKNNVCLSYRGDKFKRLKPKNKSLIEQAETNGDLKVIYNSNVIAIEPEYVRLKMLSEDTLSIENDLVYIFAGGELPTAFLEKIGIKVSKRFGHTVLSHKKKARS